MNRPDTSLMLRQYTASAPANKTARLPFGKSGMSAKSIGGDGQSTVGKKKTLRQPLSGDAGYNYDTLGGVR